MTRQVTRHHDTTSDTKGDGPWLKFYVSLVWSDKWAELSDHGRCAWMVALAQAKTLKDEGRWASEAQFRLALGVFTDAADELLSVRVVEKDGKGIRVHDWGVYQPPSDPTHAARQRAYTARQRAAGSDASLTPLEREGEGEGTSLDVADAPSKSGAAAPPSEDTKPAMPTTDEEWVTYVVAPGRNRVSRLGDYFQARFGVPPTTEQYARMGALAKGGAGITGLMVALAEAAIRGAKGDPLDYVTTKLMRRSGDVPAHDSSPGLDRNAFATRDSA
jgi:hypothetical protein